MLFRNTYIDIIDGDNRLDNLVEPYKSRLKNILRNGLHLRPIQIFHYAAPHYATRHGIAGRYINAWSTCGPSLNVINDKLYADGANEDQERQKESTEVIAVGLSNKLMCNLFHVKTNRILKIDTTGKRCDFEFFINESKIIYESKGRKYRNQLMAAQRDGASKKIHHLADEKYTIISIIDRQDKPITMYLYDPPTDEHEGYSVNREYRNIIKHYRNVSELCGLYILAEQLNNKLRHYDMTNEWNRSPLEYIKNVSKLTYHLQINHHEYLTLYKQNYDQANLEHADSFFALDKSVINLLENMDLDALYNLDMESYVEEGKYSILDNGSMMGISEILR